MRKGLFHIVVLFLSFQSYAQSTDDPFGIALEDKEYFVHTIKSVQMFMDRFNFSKDLLGNKIDTNPADARAKEFFVKDRTVSILSAFDYNWVKSASAEEQQLIREFVSQVNNLDHPVFLHFKDDQWYAELSYDAESNGKKIDLIVVMRSYLADNGGTAWTIQSIKSDALSIQASVNKLNIILPPNSDGTDFINLKQTLGSDLELERLIVQKTSLSPFFNLLLQKKVELNHIKDIRYHFLEIENFILTVEEYRRKENNSGWLISALQKASKEEKIFYGQKNLYISN